MTRISRPVMFMEMAHVVAKRSTCFRLNVGAIVVVNNNVVGIGYNGQPAGVEHCTSMCEPGKCNTIHAEANALARANLAQAGPGELEVFCTDSPCLECAAILISKQVESFYFSRQYRDLSSVDLLTRYMTVYQVLASGAVIDWVSKKPLL